MAAAFYCFFKQKKIFGISPIAFGVAAVSLISFAAGLDHYRQLLWFLGVGFVLATFLDPYIWKRYGVGGDIKFSFVLNGGVIGTGLIAYLIGYFVS